MGYTGKGPALFRKRSPPMYGLSQRFGCLIVKLRTRPSLQMTKSVSSSIRRCTVMAGLQSERWISA